MFFIATFICHLFYQFDGFIDLDGYDTLALKLKGDGRCYISTVSIMTLIRVIGISKKIIFFWCFK